MSVPVRVLLAMFFWILALTSFVLSWVNFSLLPMEATAGYAFLAVGAASGMLAVRFSRTSRPRKRLR